MRAEIVAIGTELLLGQHLDTNSAEIATRLAASGIDCNFQSCVGDNVARIGEVLEIALSRAEAVIVTGGLGPTQDDVTREALALVMGSELREDETALVLLKEVFGQRGREMPASNLRQAEVPLGARLIPQRIGTAPGLVCPVGGGVIYALPGVPNEMIEMLERLVLPELRSLAGEPAVIVSRTLRTWGLSEARLSEVVAPRIEELDDAGERAATIAFLASGIEGIKVRVSVKERNASTAAKALDTEEEALRTLLGNAVFGVDDESMEQALGALLLDRHLSLAVAESFTGGLIASRIIAVPGASRWFLGGVVTYAGESKQRLLGLGDGPVVSAPAAAVMAVGVRDLFGSDIGLATTGVAGPDPQEGLPPGTGFVGIALPGSPAEAKEMRLIGGRNHIREFATITSLDALRHRLLDTPAPTTSPSFR